MAFNHKLKVYISKNRNGIYSVDLKRVSGCT
jgi:hypothetical protein